MDDTTRRTCAHCRAKKVRCDGRQPVCGRCAKSSRGSADCSYETATAERGPGPILQKGNACLPCRRKKKRCNGERPFCATCQAVGKAGDCEYEEGQSYTAALLEKTKVLEERLATIENEPVAISTESIQQAFPNNSDEYLKSVYGSMFGQLLAPPNNGMLTPPSSSDDGSAASPPSSAVAFAGADPTLLEKLKDFRECHYKQRAQFCLNMHPLRLYALWQGDESNDFVHIAMVHASNLLGFHLWQNLNSTFSLGTEEYLRALAEESLAMLEETSDAQVPAHVPTRLQVYCTLASYHLYCRRIDISREYLSRAAEVVKKANPEALTASALEAKFDPATVDGSPYMDARNGDEEVIGSIGQLMFLDRSSSLMLALEPVLEPDFECIFMPLMYQSSPMIKSNFVIMRAIAVWLLIAARDLRSEWEKSDGYGHSKVSTFATRFPPTGQERRDALTAKYWDIVNQAEQHAALIRTAILRTSFAADSQQTVPLKSSLVTTLTAKALLHNLLGTHQESRRMAVDSIRDMTSCTEGISLDELEYMDPVVGISLASAISVVFEERKVITERPEDAIIDESWVLSTAAEMGRVFLHMEMKLPYVTDARQIVGSSCTSGGFEECRMPTPTELVAGMTPERLEPEDILRL